MAKKSGVSGALRRQVMRYGNYTCAACGLVGREEQFAGGGYGFPTNVPGVYLSIDHVTARTNGGTSDKANLQVLCTLCNTKKGVK